MKRLFLRILFAAVVVFAFSFLLIRSGHHVSLESVFDLTDPETPMLPDLLQRIRNFHRVVTRGGQRLLEVSAKEASYFRGDRAVAIVEPKIIFFDGNKQAGVISAAKGRLYLEGNEITDLEMQGSVELRIGRFTLRTQRLSYDRSHNLVTAPGTATIDSSELKLRGVGLTVDLGARTLTINAKVVMSLESSSPPRQQGPQAAGGKRL